MSLASKLALRAANAVDIIDKACSVAEGLLIRPSNSIKPRTSRTGLGRSF